MMNTKDVEKLNDHQLVDLKKIIEREMEERESGPKITTYYVTSCITETMNFADINCALRCLKQLSNQIIEYVNEEPENMDYVNSCTGIVGVKFAIRVMTEAHFKIKQNEKYFDDICFPELV